jgi:predicted transcriptional regulator
VDEFERSEITYRRGVEIVPCDWGRTAIDELAALVAKKLAISPGADIDAPIATMLGGRTHSRPVHLWTVPGSVFIHGRNDFDIVTEALASEPRRRFTVAHELGHYFLHSAQGEVPLIANRLGSSPAERECNWFAAALLMPEEEFRNEVKKEGAEDEGLAQQFGVSATAVAIRKRSLGLAG